MLEFPPPGPLDGLTEFLTPTRTLQTLWVLRLGFFMLFVWLLLRISCCRLSGKRLRGRGAGLILPLLVLSLLAIYLYQATWQLAGFVRPRFIVFMERYDPRPSQAARRLVRGRLLDAFGRELAVSDASMRGARRYPYGAATAHVVGYRHPIHGHTGMEQAADAMIGGYLLETRADYERAGRNALRETREVGSDLRLTLDAELQEYAFVRMEQRPGAIVGIDPADGSIRLLVSTPSFDPNAFDPRLNLAPDSPLFNRALHGRYPPGSTFKLAIAALAVEQRVATILHCPAEGYTAPGARRPIRDHEYYAFERRGAVWGGHGRLDLTRAFAKSSNTYFAQIGVLSGPEAFNDLAERLWINGRIPLYDGPSGMLLSQRGHVPNLGRHDHRELSQLSIGQGRLLMTPLHMAMLTAAVANEGALWRPRIVATEPARRLPPPMRRDTARSVRDAMREAVRSGTGRAADIPGLDVCGKTGTAQQPGGESHAWFVSFAPARNPRLALVVLVEGAGHGSRFAVPVAADILRRAQVLGRFDPPTATETAPP